MLINGLLLQATKNPFTVQAAMATILNAFIIYALFKEAFVLAVFLNLLIYFSNLSLPNHQSNPRITWFPCWCLSLAQQDGMLLVAQT